MNISNAWNDFTSFFIGLIMSLLLLISLLQKAIYFLFTWTKKVKFEIDFWTWIDFLITITNLTVYLLLVVFYYNQSLFLGQNFKQGTDSIVAIATIMTWLKIISVLLVNQTFCLYFLIIIYQIVNIFFYIVLMLISVIFIGVIYNVLF